MLKVNACQSKNIYFIGEILKALALTTSDLAQKGVRSGDALTHDPQNNLNPAREDSNGRRILKAVKSK